MKNKKNIIYAIIYSIIAIMLCGMCIWQFVMKYYALNQVFLLILFILVLIGDIFTIKNIFKNNKKTDK